MEKNVMLSVESGFKNYRLTRSGLQARIQIGTHIFVLICSRLQLQVLQLYSK